MFKKAGIGYGHKTGTPLTVSLVLEPTPGEVRSMECEVDAAAFMCSYAGGVTPADRIKWPNFSKESKLALLNRPLKGIFSIVSCAAVSSSAGRARLDAQICVCGVTAD
jgi:hypothetical protein